MMNSVTAIAFNRNVPPQNKGVRFSRLASQPALSQPINAVEDTFKQTTDRAPIVSLNSLKFGDPIARKQLVGAFVQHGYVYLKPDTVDGKRLLDLSAETIDDFSSRISNPQKRKDLQDHYQTGSVLGAGYTDFYSFLKDLRDPKSFEEVYKKPDNVKNYNHIQTFQMLGKTFLDPLHILDAQDDPYNLEFQQRKIYMGAHRVAGDILKAIQSVYKPKQNLNSLIELGNGGASRIVAYDSPHLAEDNSTGKVLVSATHKDSALFTLAIKETGTGLHRVNDDGTTTLIPIKEDYILAFPGKLLELMSNDSPKPIKALNHCVYNHGKRSAQVVFVSPDNGLDIRSFERDELLGPWNKIVEKNLGLDKPTQRAFRQMFSNAQQR